MGVSLLATARSGVLLVAMSGCATASNSAWLHEPEAGMSLEADLVAPLEPAQHGAETWPLHAGSAWPQQESGSDAARPRLARTVTLGGESAPGQTPEAAQAAAPAGSPVQVTINNYVTQPSYGYGYVPAYEPVFARPRSDTSVGNERNPRGGSKPSGSTVRPGQDFPAPPSYGPSFPFKTAPANPWL